MVALLIWGAYLFFAQTKNTLKLELATGDKIEIDIDTTKNANIKLKSTDKTLQVKNGAITMLKMSFVKEDDWLNYISNHSNDILSTQSGNKNGIRYEFIQEDDQTVMVAWIVGSDSGMLVYGSNVSKSKMTEIFHSLTFVVKKTAQTDSEYCPSITDIEMTVEENQNIFDKWTNFKITIDKLTYELPCTYETFKEGGWVIEGSDATETQKIEGGTTLDEVKLVNEAYGTEYDDFAIVCQLRNDEKKDQNVEDCMIYKISLDAATGMKLKETYPEINIMNTVGFKSTETAIKNMFGEPTDIYENDYCSILTYESGKNKTVQFIVYEEYGLVGIDITWNIKVDNYDIETLEEIED